MNTFIIGGSAQDLLEALKELDRRGIDLHTMYIENSDGILLEQAQLVERTLTDGSTVYNLVIS